VAGTVFILSGILPFNFWALLKTRLCTICFAISLPGDSSDSIRTLNLEMKR
jgi:hypothetical protein